MVQTTWVGVSLTLGHLFFGEISFWESAWLHPHPSLLYASHSGSAVELDYLLARCPANSPLAAVTAKHKLGSVCRIFGLGPIFREGCQFLYSLGVLRVTCYLNAVILHFQCFEAFYKSELIHGFASA